MKRRKRNITIITFLIIIGVAAYLMYVGNPANNQEETNSAENINMTDKNNEGLIVVDIEVGSGKEAKAGDTAIMHYTGTLDDGTKFDSSVDRGDPLEFTLGTGMVIAGWDEGIPGMKVGGKRKLTIPSEMAYGDAGTGPIPGGATLHFDVELVGIK